MRVRSGVSHPLMGTNAWQRPGQPAPPAQRRETARAAAPVAAAPVAAPAISAPAVAARHVAAAAPLPKRPKPRRLRALTLASLAASAVVLGCATIPAPQWRVEPSYRLQDSGAATAQGWLALARVHEGEDRPAQAIAAYRKATLAAPGSADLHNALGVAMARHGEFGQAVVALRRAVALAPERAQLLNNLGYALLLDGRDQESRAIFRLALALDPQHAQAGRNLSYADERLAAVPAGGSAAVVPAVAVAVSGATPAAAVPVPALVVAPAPAAATALAAAPAATPPMLPSVADAAKHGSAAAVVATPATAAPTPVAISAATTAAVVPAAALPGMPAVLALAQAPAQSPALPASLDGVSVEVVNGNGIAGTAGRMRGWLQERGIGVGRLANLLPYNSQQTQVLYRPGKAEQARSMALRLPVVAHVLPAAAGSTRADLGVLIGHDVIYSAGCSELSVCATPERLSTAAARPQ